MEELEIEEIKEVNNNILKVFVYNAKGEKIREDFYSSFLEVYDYVLEHNSEYPNDPYNIYPGVAFPPKGYKWGEDVGDWVELNLFEKWQRNEIQIPNDCKIINNIIVKKNLKELYDDGIINIPNTKKIDEELNLIIDKSEQDLIDEGALDWDMVYDRLYNDFKIKLDNYLDIYYFKYPKAIIAQFREKTDMAKRWVSLTREEKDKEKAFDFFNFQLLISEIKGTDMFINTFQLEDRLESLCEKIIKKNNELELKIGSISILFNNLYEEILSLKDKKNYLLLLEFVHSVDNKIITWIKS